MSKMYKCTCGAEVVEFQKEDDDTTWITIFTCGSPANWTWRFRLRLIWDIVRGQRIYGDQINITKEDGYDLAEYLISTEK